MKPEQCRAISDDNEVSFVEVRAKRLDGADKSQTFKFWRVVTLFWISETFAGIRNNSPPTVWRFLQEHGTKAFAARVGV